MGRVAGAMAWRWVAAVAAVGVLAVACTSAGDGSASTASTAPSVEEGRDLLDEGEPQAGGSLAVGLMADVDGYHPVRSNWTTEGHLVGSAIFDPLMAYDADGVPQPFLAESLTPSDDFRSWTIEVRPDVVFHDGTPLDGEAVARNLETALFEGLASIAFEGVVDRVEVAGPLAATVHLNDAYPVLPHVLAGLAGYMAAPSMLDDPDGARNPVGTGPFVFEGWTPGASLEVRANPDYWRTDDEGRALPYLDEVSFQFLLDEGDRYRALQAGEVDLILTTSAASAVDAEGDGGLVVVEDGRSEETFVMLNAGAPPFDDRNAREAVAFGTDPEAVVALTQAGEALVATSPFAAGTAWAVEDDGWVGYDPARARAAVEAYEATHGEPLAFTISGVPTTDTGAVLQVLEQQWAELGIEATIDTLEPTAYLVGVTIGDYQAAWFRSYSYHDPLYLYPFFHSRFANGPGQLSTNFSQVQDPDLDELLVEGLTTDDDGRRQEVYAEVVQGINDELVDVWLFHTPYSLIARDVGGLNEPRAIGFANLEPKPWIGGLWRTR